MGTEKLSKRAVLIVEDDEVNQFVLQEQLEGLGYESVVASNGLEALATHAKAQFLFILMDVYMPKMGGLDATAEIRQIESQQNLPPVPILALTSDDDAETQQKCMAAGMDGMLYKPVSPNTLSAAIAKLVVNGAWDITP